jgi:signal transduction histidine kinase
MAEVLFAEGQYQQAIGFAQKCLDNDQTRDTLLIRLSCLEQLALALQSAGNYQLALQNYIELNKLNEQISNDKVKQLAAIMAIEMDVKDTKLKLEQARRNQQQIELELAQQQRRFMLLVASTILLVLLLSFYYYRRYSLRKLEFERRKNEALINLDKLKDRILANTSHELRTPLNGIIGLADYLLACDDEVGSEERKSSLQLIKRSGEQLAEIVNDILDLASLRAGRMQFQYSQFQLDELVRDKCELLKPLAKAKAIDLRCDLPAAPVHISSDPKRIGQVLVNLLGNAIKFTDEGGVTEKLQADNKQCRIHIMDTGIGIPEQHVERIFEGFEQVNAGNTRPFAGSGLGLAICREILAGLGGKIKLSSQVGKGTQIEISLPLEKKAT